MGERSNNGQESKSGSSSGGSVLLGLNDQIDEVLSERPWDETGRNARTLAKYSDFRVVLTALKKGTSLDEHRAKGCISIQTLRGRISVRLQEQEFEISNGQLLVLNVGLPHAVNAIEDSVFLITMSFKP